MLAVHVGGAGSAKWHLTNVCVVVWLAFLACKENVSTFCTFTTQDNPLLHEVFNFHPRQEAADRLTALEKRLYRSPASAESKARAQDRRRERELMASYKGSMLSME